VNRSYDEHDGQPYRHRGNRYTATADQDHHAGRADDECRDDPDAETDDGPPGRG
jgi:hypothetical protein